jgi:hypothetical protein
VSWGAFGKRPAGEDSCAIVSPKTFPDAEGPAHFNVAHAIRVANDGMVYLADRENQRVQMFTNDGKFVKQLIRTGTTFARNLALSADARQQFLYAGADKGITVVDRKTLDVVGTIQPFVPMVFNFDKPETKDFAETVRLLANLSRFVIVDITNPRSTPLELQAAVPDYMVPFVPILQQGEEPFSMFVD